MREQTKNPVLLVAQQDGMGWKSWGDFRMSFHSVYHGSPQIASRNEVKTELGGRT